MSMSTTQIPNLNTLRRGGPRSKGRGGAAVVGSGGGKSQNEIVRNTDNDAATSRLSAVNGGYLDDPFARLLTDDTAQRRLPLMNRGTYVRTVGIDRIVSTFISSTKGRKQIISLGAGSDTRYFRLKRKQPDLDLLYHEIDFESNTKTKIERIQSASFSQAVHEMCSMTTSDFDVQDGNLRSSNYHIHAQDLRTLPERLPSIDISLPTLLISECCLIYLSPEEANGVITYFTNIFSSVPLAIAIYEPIRPNDPFGRTMVRNLIARGIHLQTLQEYAELTDQQARLREHGFDARAEDIHYIWQNWIKEEEKDRVEGLEWMDEVEEFVLLGKHYCISWGWRGETAPEVWRGLPVRQ